MAAVTWPYQYQKQNGYKFITVMCNDHSPTDKSARSGVNIIQRPWSLAKADGFILEPGVGARTLTWFYLSSTNASTRYEVIGKGPKPHLAH